MSSSWRGTPSSADVGPRAKCDQVIYEAIAKAAEIVVQSRCPVNTSAPSSFKSASSSSRFNLHIPENPDVRKVLFPFKRSLHVPLRLDVYHRRSGDQRELLERWCLEYAPCHLAFFQQECGNPDPLVQLRHVCKKLVLWLRTLYCLSRVLPCPKSAQIGFSIYVSDESHQDVMELTQNSGFLQQPHSSVYTPYGRLDLQAVHAPRNVIQKLFPKQPTARWTNNNVKTASRPIPTSNSNHRRNSWNQKQLEPQSAPAHISLIPDYTSSPSVHPQQVQQPQMATTLQDQYHLDSRSRSLKTPMMDQQPQQRGSRPAVSRTQSAVSDRDVSYHSNQETPQGQKRVLSGLSLALMNAEEQEEPSPRSEQRRVALHHAPPSTIKHQDATNSPRPGDYGYAYNNHIPWGHLGNNAVLPSTPTRSAVLEQQHQETTSAAPVLSSTPPQPMFVGSKTPPPYEVGAAPLLLPPMSSKKRDTEITPPFAAVPTSLGATPKAPILMPPQHANPVPLQQQPPQEEEAALPPVSSLDLLHSSPFKTQEQQLAQQNSLLSSLSGTTTEQFYSQTQSSLPAEVLLRSGAAWMGSTFLDGPHETDHVDDSENDMPFAVDSATSVPAASVAEQPHGSSSSSNMDLGASAALAHKCATASRLKLFDSTCVETPAAAAPQQPDPVVSSLANQLAEFRSFGASLTVANPGNDDASTSTPISLKT